MGHILNKIILLFFIISCSSSNISWEKNEYASYKMIKDGDIFFSIGNINMALEKFEEAGKLYPSLMNEASFVVRLVKANGRLNNKTKLTLINKRVREIKKDKNNMEIYHYMLGKISYYMLDMKEMLKQYRLAEKYSPKERKGLYKCLVAMGKCSKERSIYSSIK